MKKTGMLNIKKLEFCATSLFASTYSTIETAAYCSVVTQLFNQHGYDMYVFSNPTDGILAVDACGFNFKTEKTLEKNKRLFTTESLPIKKFWCKIDYQGNDKFVGTFLFPEEYQIE